MRSLLVTSEKNTITNNMLKKNNFDRSTVWESHNVTKLSQEALIYDCHDNKLAGSFTDISVATTTASS